MNHGFERAAEVRAVQGKEGAMSQTFSDKTKDANCFGLAFSTPLLSRRGHSYGLTHLAPAHPVSYISLWHVRGGEGDCGGNERGSQWIPTCEWLAFSLF